MYVLYHVALGLDLCTYARCFSFLNSVYASRATVAVLPGHRIKECIFLILSFFDFSDDTEVGLTEETILSSLEEVGHHLEDLHSPDSQEHPNGTTQPNVQYSHLQCS